MMSAYRVERKVDLNAGRNFYIQIYASCDKTRNIHWLFGFYEQSPKVFQEFLTEFKMRRKNQGAYLLESMPPSAVLALINKHWDKRGKTALVDIIHA